MCASSVVRPIADVIWDLCGCHAGIASAVLFKLGFIFSSKRCVDPARLVLEANSSRLLEWVSEMRGVPTPSRLNATCQKNNIAEDDCKRCFEILDIIACTFGEFAVFFKILPVGKILGS